ncbi:MAG: electron transporter RnfC, partial [Candidatus Omnitrophica bacterium]|nr:electron transporter RnfC [Candidatus Omnitrophota bacterium]
MVRVKEYKGFTEDKKIEPLPFPKKVFIPLSQHLGRPAELQVRLEEEIEEGQLIARSSANISSNIHSSISVSYTHL